MLTAAPPALLPSSKRPDGARVWQWAAGLGAILSMVADRPSGVVRPVGTAGVRLDLEGGNRSSPRSLWLAATSELWNGPPATRDNRNS